MTSTETYKKFELKINKLSTNDNIDISPGEFVLIYNEQQNKKFEFDFRDRSTRKIDMVQKLIVKNSPLTKRVVENNYNYSDFKLPSNYFDYISSYSLATSGPCKDRVIYNEELKLANENILYKDDYNTPSFDYQEGFVSLANDGLQVYTNGFEVTNTFMTYYRYPVEIDIEGYIKIDGTTLSTNINPELPDSYVDKIIDWCVREVTGTYSDIEGYQVANNKTTQNEQ